MPDYNIYLHSVGGGNGGSSAKTTAWENQPESENDLSFFTSANRLVSGASQFASSGFNPMFETGVASLMKSIPALAVIYLGSKLTDNVLSVGFTHLETYTGHYEYSMGFNNFKTAFTNYLNPIGTAMKNYQRQFQFNLENKKIEQERQLIGNSIFDISIRGV